MGMKQYNYKGQLWQEMMAERGEPIPPRLPKCKRVGKICYKKKQAEQVMAEIERREADDITDYYMNVYKCSHRASQGGQVEHWHIGRRHKTKDDLLVSHIRALAKSPSYPHAI